MLSPINKNIKYINEIEVLTVHAKIIDYTGGTHGIRDVGLIKGALQRPQTITFGNEIFPTIFDKASAYFDSIARNHPFVDGNKRTAFASAVLFIEKNGYLFDAPNDEVEHFVVRAVADHLDIGDIALWLKKNSKKI